MACDDIKLEALRLAVSTGEPPHEVVKRASAYEAYLKGLDSYVEEKSAQIRAARLADAKGLLG